MPPWLARWVPPAFDGLAPQDIYPAAEAFLDVLEATTAYTPADWDSLSRNFRAALVEQAVGYARPGGEGKPYWPAVARACGEVVAALKAGDNDALQRAAGAAEVAAARAAGATEGAEGAEAAGNARAARAARAAGAAAWAAGAAAGNAWAAGAAEAARAAGAAGSAAWAAGAARGAARMEQFTVLRRLV